MKTADIDPLGNDYGSVITPSLINTPKKSINVVKTDVKDKSEMSKIRTGTIPNAIFNYTNAITGASMLALPYAIYCAGFIPGLCLCVLILLITMLTAHILCESSFSYTNGFRSYQECLEKYLGYFWKKVCETIILIYITGICVVYLIVISQFTKSVIDALTGGEYYLFADRMFIKSFLGVTLIFPFTLLREIKKLGFIAFVALCGCVYLGIFLFTHGVITVVGSDYGPGEPWFYQIKLYNGFYPIFFLALPMICFCFHCHILMFPVSYELKFEGVVKNRKKMDVVIVVSLLLVFCIYMIIGVCGIMIFGDKLQDNVLNNFDGFDIFANIARLAYGITITFSFPIQNYAGRLAFQSLFMGTTTKKLGTVSYLTLAVLYFFVILVIALFVPMISIVFSFLGAICPTFLMYIFPALLSWKVVARKYPKQRFMWYGVSIFLVCMGLFVFSTGLTASILKFIEAMQNHFGEV